MTEERGATMTRRRADTRRRLIDAAYEAFSERGIRDTPVELICERAGFTRGAFYSNFSSKEDLFLTLFQEETAVRLERFHDATESVLGETVVHAHDDLSPALGRIAELFMVALSADKNWYLLCAEFRTQGLRQPEIRDRIGAAFRYFHTELAKVLVGALDRIERKLTISPDDAVLVLVALYEQGLQNYLLEGTELPGDGRFVSELIPKVMASLIVPAT
ncbi:TetR/AcrR family transcriptional regulator [Amycolatopsis sp. BJA-103]|uniref:TetR/AcrR family transcriptional regulator n=1 Tax=unclassified Amycolatopsis TaxID=2618356 RepID=UPI000C763D02|nr:TetR family transcriptional regulator [Amycolatopsis sp. BJA-103]AUI59771.1 TetR family transcriptional regulator [Amycolatopsis sp. BJA-103]PNE14700.1 TetR family transcriptional regulator [Amycolatopsis sp. BJA-103]